MALLAVRLLGLLGLFVSCGFFGCSSLRTALAFRLLELLAKFLGFSSLRASWAVGLLGLLGLFVS